MSLTLRTNPTCPHCSKEKPGAINREVLVDGVNTMCARCGNVLGDSHSMEIPTGLEPIVKALITRAMMEVTMFHEEREGAVDRRRRVTPKTLMLEHRAGKVRCQLEWFSVPEDDRAQDPARLDFIALKDAEVPMVAAVAQNFVNCGFFAVEVPRRDLSEGVIRFRKYSLVSTKVGMAAATDEKILIRAQLSWWK